jgi:glycosyltransferase involved in cell wall biosynthesis
MGGAENLVLQIIRNLDRSKYNIYLAAFTDEGDMYNNYKELNVEILCFPKKKFRFFKSAFRFARFLKQNRINCIHVHLVGTYFFAVTIGKLMRVGNIIVHWHNVYDYKKFNSSSLKGYYKKLRRWFLLTYSGKLANSVIAISKRVKDENSKRFRISPDKAHVIYNAIDFSLIPENNGTAGSTKEMIIGSIGKVTEQKGFDNLIRAFHLVNQSYPESRLEIIGDYNTKGNHKYCQNLESLIKEFNIEDKVNFLGKMPNNKVYEKLFSWTLFALASKWEGFGIVLIEAMAAGIPVVGNNIDAIPEVIDDQETGLISKTNDYNDMGQKIISLMEDKTLSDKLSTNAKIRVKEKYSMDRMVNELDALYYKK